MNMDDVRRLKLDKVRKIPIEEFDLSVRAYNGLKRLNIHTLGDLEEKTEEELLKSPIINQRAVEEIEDKLSAYSLYLKGAEYRIPFRNVLKNLAIVFDSWSLTSYTQHSVDDCEKIKGANSLLCYAYMDNMAGLTYQVLGATYYIGGDYYLVGEREKLDYKIRAESLIYNRVYPIKNKALVHKYKEQIDFIDKHYMSNEKVNDLLDIEFLDAFRHPAFPNDLLVTLHNPDYEKCEGVWVRVDEQLPSLQNGEEVFKGRLLSEPWKDFGVHGGDIIYFINHKVKDGTVLLHSTGFNDILK